jgi:hypothetical protein
MKLIYQPLGTSSLVGIESHNKEEYESQYFSFWNHGATSGKLHEMSEGFHYITTSDEKLESYFVNSSLHLILNKFPEKFKNIAGGAMLAARELAERRFQELKENTEVFYSTKLHDYDYSVSKCEPVDHERVGHTNDEEEWKQKACDILAGTSAKRLA